MPFSTSLTAIVLTLASAAVARAEAISVFSANASTCLPTPLGSNYYNCQSRSLSIEPAAVTPSSHPLLGNILIRNRLVFSHRCESTSTLIGALTLGSSLTVNIAALRDESTSTIETQIEDRASRYELTAKVAQASAIVKPGCHFDLVSNISFPLLAQAGWLVSSLDERLSSLIEIRTPLVEAGELPAQWRAIDELPQAIQDRINIKRVEMMFLARERDMLQSEAATRQLTDLETARLRHLRSGSGAIEKMQSELEALSNQRDAIEHILTIGGACEGDPSASAACLTHVADVKDVLDAQISAARADLTDVSAWLGAEASRLQTADAALAAEIRALLVNREE